MRQEGNVLETLRAGSIVWIKYGLGFRSFVFQTWVWHKASACQDLIRNSFQTHHSVIEVP